MKPHLTFRNGQWVARLKNKDGKRLAMGSGETPKEAIERLARRYNIFWRV